MNPKEVPLHEARKTIDPAHIGDGVYASFDGYHLNLAVNRHDNHVVSLEPAVLRELIHYARRVDEVHGVAHFRVPTA